MKNKKWIWIVIVIVVVIAVVISCFGIHKIKAKKNLELHEIANIEKSDATIPVFTIVVRGAYEGTITNLDLEQKDVQVYEFDAGIDNGWDIVTNHYTGVKLLDVLKAMGMTEYGTIDFMARGDVNITYNKSEINDKTYLVFYRDGKPIRENEPVTLLSIDYQYRYSLENIWIMSVK